MADIFKADLVQMAEWARGIMASRPPDFTVGEDYLRRWWVVPRNDFSNVYLHEFRVSDEDRALHDHPWPSTSFLIEGQYLEHTPEATFLRCAGDVVSREAGAFHRIELIHGHPTISLFITGPKQREWGFACEQGWVHWQDFTASDDPGAVGKGCGEPGDLSPVTQPGKLPKKGEA